MKKVFLVVGLMGSLLFSGCVNSSEPTVRSEESSSSMEEIAEYSTDENRKELLAGVEKAEIDTDDEMWEKRFSEETLRTASNGVKKLVGLDGKTELVGYKTYKVLDNWELDESRTEDKEKDAIWKILGENEVDSYVEVYMLAAYTGDIANLQGKKLSEDDLDDLLASDGTEPQMTSTTQLDDTEWHVGIEMWDEYNMVRVTFYRMEEDAGDFNESVQIAQVITPLSIVLASDENKEEFFTHISLVKKMLTTFSETKEKEVPVS